MTYLLVLLFMDVPEVPHEDDPRQRKPDITLAKNALGWEPGVMLEEGLKDTIEYFRNFVEGVWV